MSFEEIKGLWSERVSVESWPVVVSSLDVSFVQCKKDKFWEPTKDNGWLFVSLRKSIFDVYKFM